MPPSQGTPAVLRERIVERASHGDVTVPACHSRLLMVVQEVAALQTKVRQGKTEQSTLRVRDAQRNLQGDQSVDGFGHPIGEFRLWRTRRQVARAPQTASLPR